MDKKSLALACAFALSSSITACGPETAPDGAAAGGSTAAASGSHSFDPSTGTLNVDYAGYLSKHDLVFNSPITTPSNGPTVATGRIGAQVWNSNGLTMQVTGVDNSQQTGFSSGLVNLRTSPGMDSGYTTFQQRLNLYDGTITATYDQNRTVTVMGVPNAEVFGIHVEDARSGVSSVTLDLSIWDLSGLPSSSTSMYLDEPSMGTWKTVSTYADSTGAGFSRGQTDANGFGYTLAASVEGAGYTASVVNGSTVRLTITPTSSYTIWIANATRKWIAHCWLTLLSEIFEKDENVAPRRQKNTCSPIAAGTMVFNESGLGNPGADHVGGCTERRNTASHKGGWG